MIKNYSDKWTCRMLHVHVSVRVVSVQDLAKPTMTSTQTCGLLPLKNKQTASSPGLQSTIYPNHLLLYKSCSKETPLLLYLILTTMTSIFSYIHLPCVIIFYPLLWFKRNSIQLCSSTVVNFLATVQLRLSVTDGTRQKCWDNWGFG